MVDKAYDYGYRYQDFMCRAYKTRDINSRTGIDRGLMMSIVLTEQGKAIKPKPLESQLDNIKGYINKGIEKMLKFKLNEDEHGQLLFAQNQLQSANNSESLVRIIGIAMDSTSRLKEQ